MTFTIEKMYRLPDAGSLLAFADVCADNAITIRGCRVLRGAKGLFVRMPQELFVRMPQEQGRDNKWYDQVVCKRADVFDALTHAILKYYVEQTGESILDDVPKKPKPVDVWTNVQ